MNTNINTNTSQTERITLYYREGSSDKVYQASIEPQGELFVVNFAFGRRGCTLSSGTKTSAPVDEDAARIIYDKLVREKKAKGYTEGPDGTPYQHTAKKDRVTGLLPQLLNPIDEKELASLINDSVHCAQEKYDGKRVLIRKAGLEIVGINRKGLEIGLALPIVQAAREIPEDFVLDGECVGELFCAFDMLGDANLDLKREPYQKRLASLIKLLALATQRQIRFAETAFNPMQKKDLLSWLKRAGKEGMVFKRLDAPYTPGRPNSGGPQLKHKFYATCSAVVAKVNDKRSVELRLLNGEGWQPVGNVTIPVNFQVPEVDEVVEVRYFHAFKESNALYQPVYLGPRQDIAKLGCLLSQLKYKGTGEEDPC